MIDSDHVSIDAPMGARLRWCHLERTASLPTRSGTQSIERAIAVLECLSAAEAPLTLTEIARRVGLTREHDASAAAGARDMRVTSTRISRPSSTDSASASPCSGSGRSSDAGYQLARPVLAALSERTGESASLGVRRGAEVVVLDRVAGPAPLRFDHPAGAELAVHASAMGKVLLAFSETSIAEEVRTFASLERFTTGDHRRSSGTAQPNSPTCSERGYAIEQRGAIRRRVRYCGTRALVQWPRPRRRWSARVRASG